MNHRNLVLIFQSKNLGLIKKEALNFLNASQTLSKINYSKSLFIILIIGVTDYLISGKTPTRLMKVTVLACSILVGKLVYFILIILFKIKEVEWILGLIKAKFKSR